MFALNATNGFSVTHCTLLLNDVISLNIKSRNLRHVDFFKNNDSKMCRTSMAPFTQMCKLANIAKFLFESNHFRNTFKSLLNERISNSSCRRLICNSCITR